MAKKNLFNSSDKSNFILNMTEEQYSKYASIALIIACFSVPLATLVPEITSKATYSITTVGLIISGVICLITALISLIKKFIEKELLLPVCAFGFIVLWGVISLINGFDTTIGFYGYPQRGEGLLAILFYFSFFITAASIKRKKALKALIIGIILTGWLNSAVALIQIFAKELSHYNSISIYFLFAASGLSMSPIFLAMVLTLSMTASAVEAMIGSSKKLRIFSVISITLFSFVVFNTYSLMGIFAVGFSFITAVVIVFAKKAPKIRLASLIAPIASGALSVILIATGTTSYLNTYKLADGRTLWTGDAYKRASASGDYDPKSVNIDNTYDVYYHLNRKTMNIIKDYPLTGTGPEQLVFPQLYTKKNAIGAELTETEDIIAENKGTFDKVYNEYLYTAATRGVPSLIALIVLVASVLYIGGKKMKKSGSVENTILFCVVLGGALTFLIGCSNIAFSPIFWAAAGACCTMEEKTYKKK